ncbi:hypothetical protein OSB04_005205 [Centaurea solstitialis]|uniref:DNA topoisomerase (ATP-hydrolyzing) n=1 Tax=Centaurea solstitialis TaxID=347529 RepID=A0AA38WPG9_9ASTR|nr:hypothetical protein OSB04_005205 [Centaurea solstitialis]
MERAIRIGRLQATGTGGNTVVENGTTPARYSIGSMRTGKDGMIIRGVIGPRQLTSCSRPTREIPESIRRELSRARATRVGFRAPKYSTRQAREPYRAYSMLPGEHRKRVSAFGTGIVSSGSKKKAGTRGKLLNVSNAPVEQVLENVDIVNLIRILGLQIGKKYDNVKSFRYGHLIIMSDQYSVVVTTESSLVLTLVKPIFKYGFDIRFMNHDIRSLVDRRWSVVVDCGLYCLLSAVVHVNRGRHCFRTMVVYGSSDLWLEIQIGGGLSMIGCG